VVSIELGQMQVAMGVPYSTHTPPGHVRDSCIHVIELTMFIHVHFGPPCKHFLEVTMCVCGCLHPQDILRDYLQSRGVATWATMPDANVKPTATRLAAAYEGFARGVHPARLAALLGDLSTVS
jgi:hypothetical protein